LNISSTGRNFAVGQHVVLNPKDPLTRRICVTGDAKSFRIMENPGRLSPQTEPIGHPDCGPGCIYDTMML